MVPGQTKNKKKAGDNETLFSEVQGFPVFDTFAKKDIAEWMKADKLQGITDGMIADLAENRE